MAEDVAESEGIVAVKELLVVAVGEATGTN